MAQVEEHWNGIQGYLQSNIIGENQLPIENCNWVEAFITFRDKSERFYIAIDGYYRASVMNSSLDRRYNIIDRNLEMLKAKKNFDDNYMDFWNSMISLNYIGQGYVDGDIIPLSEFEIYYKTYTKEIYDKYISDLKGFMDSVKELFKSCSSNEPFEDYIPK